MDDQPERLFEELLLAVGEELMERLTSDPESTVEVDQLTTAGKAFHGH